jgi:multiple sugar transport system substrate-binding protein
MDDLLPSIIEQGTYADRIWAVGMFDSGLGMYGLRSVLEEVGARIPEGPEDAWTVDEFDEMLADLRDAGYERPLDVKKNYGQGEYYAYLYQPFVWSSGANVIADDFSTTDGHLNSPEAVEALTHFQNVAPRGLRRRERGRRRLRRGPLAAVDGRPLGVQPLLRDLR